jgi:tetratricopeptide (TPR) repeat protein/CHAT domain-containing protein
MPAVPQVLVQAPAAAKPSPTLTAEQQKQLKERDQLGRRAVQLRSQGKLPEAIQAAEAMLAIEREVLGGASEDAIGSLELLARLHQDREDWAAARKAREEVLKLRSTTLPKDDWRVGDARLALDNIETVAKLSDRDRRRLGEADRLVQQVEELHARGKYSEAMRPARQALAIREALLGERHPDLAGGLNNLGVLLQNQGDYGEARGYLRRALEMDQALYPKERYRQGHPALAAELANLGNLLQDQGSYVEAREYYQRALEMREALYPKERYPQGHLALAQSLNHLGTVLKDQGDYVVARGYYQRALEMREALYPKERYPRGHPDLANSLNDLGGLLFAQGNYGEARGYYQRALEMNQALYPRERYPQGHPYLATNLNNLGVLLEKQGDYGEARGYFQRALEMTRAQYPKERYPQGHPALATELANLGHLLQEQGNYVDAREYLQRVLEMNQALYPREQYPQGHPHLAVSLSNLGVLFQKQGNYGEARAYYQRALEMAQALYPRERYPRGHPDLALRLNNLGALLLEQGDYGEARGYYQRALEMRQALYPKERYPRGHPALAESLNNLGGLLHAQGNYAEARGYFQRALEIFHALYPRERYPQGHPDLVVGLNNLGVLLQKQGDYGEARVYFQQALEMRQALYPRERYPRGHPALATELANLGDLLQDQGNYGEARGYLQRALEMTQALYPRERYPRGHPDLALRLNNLGALLLEQGNFAEARGYYQRALEIRQALFPRERYAQGHPDLAGSLNNLGVVLQKQGNYGEARGYLQRALEMRQALYPKERYPRGHPDLAVSLNNMGGLLVSQGGYGEARGYYQRALEMRQALYPKERYPRGHPDLALSQNNMGSLLVSQGGYGEARGYYQRALEMDQALYPKEQYPQGHPELEHHLSNMGLLLRSEGKDAEAWPLLLQAADINQDLAEAFLAATSEAEALDYLAQLPATRSLLISTSLHLPESSEDVYAQVWRGKAAVARTLQRRQASLFDLARTDPATRQAIETWNDRRRQLARLLLAPSDGRDDAGRLRQLRELTAEKERLERRLAEALPEFARQQRLDRSPHTRLLEALPDRAVVLDLVQFTRIEQDPQVRGKKGERRTPSYVGFVLARGRPVRRVDLGPAQPIDEAVAGWRKAIVARRDDPAAEALRRRVWEPLAKHFPPNTATVLIAPDGALSAVPWAALPGDRPGTVLLERYALALVPHAPFLLDRLTAPPSRGAAGDVLALGGVAYGQAPRLVDDEKTQLELLAARQAETQRSRGDGWTELPGTRAELETVVQLAGARRVDRLEGTAASTAGLLRALPRARWAHIATHGFFADPAVPSVLRPDPQLFARPGGDRAAPGARNPLVLSGLVLAGANRPSADSDATAHDDLGILTAEAIAGLPLQGLELAVLSACETGLGTVAGGEGVFGLQRAFHLAGAHTVVASLWKVDDAATRKLMRLFYSNLWEQGMTAAEALRQAQLTMLNEAVGIGDRPCFWAGWVLSGDPGVQ